MKEDVNQLSNQEVKEIFEDKQSKQILVDVREYEEYVDQHIPGIPLVPMSEIAEKVEDFKKDESYVFVCRSGRRSHEVSRFFLENGFQKVANYDGGMLNWDGPVETGEENIVDDVKDIYKEG
ncbi:rhodanese-like domain-containing protein [Gracilibacillus sp. YIM 98692]|uniref:rhodanese-like domain-containing protein n=1 Tax=Gracilibacillus sp. YIM 98692 TaxID=2663532 RepID=UPI001F0893EA|nr:rhodanese-like domain-containing protein [Gracilibacillus sp. YIM 98692]